MNEFVQTLKSFGIGRLAAIIGVGVGVAIALALIIVRIGEPKLSVLYSGLSLEEADAVSTRLEQDNIPFQIKDHQGTIAVLAPQKEKQRLRLSLAADGFVADQGIGYEIFDQTSSFGSTTFQQNINRLRALEGELARTISSIGGVRSARVHLVLPERELFTRDRKEASASIIVNAPGGIETRSVRAIINLVASAVPGLSVPNVTVLDSTGALLAAGGSADDAMGNSIDERTASTEARFKRIVEDIVGRIVGAENIRVQVSAELDFNRVTESAEIIDPDSQTVLSSTVVEEISNDNDNSASQGVSIGNSLPGAQEVDPSIAGGSASSRNRTEETTNYEISRTVRNEVREQGGVKRLSVAVALNTPSFTLADGSTSTTPRSEQEIERIKTLVASAIGFQSARGDSLEVIEAPFAIPQSPAFPSISSTGSSQSSPPFDVMRIAELVALSMIAIALIIFIVKPLLEGQLLQSRPETSPFTGLPEADELASELSASDHSNVTNFSPDLRDSSASQVSDIVKSNTDQSLGILKTWLRDVS